MISLDVRKYCENCPNFEADVDKIYCSNGEVLTTIRCANSRQCHEIKTYLETVEKEKKK